MRAIAANGLVAGRNRIRAVQNTIDVYTNRTAGPQRNNMMRGC
jgi:hypothetical protein